MPCMNCINEICQSRCLPSRELMLKQLKPKIKEDMFESFSEKPTEFIVAVYNQAFFSTEVLSRKRASQRDMNL